MLSQDRCTEDPHFSRFKLGSVISDSSSAERGKQTAIFYLHSSDFKAVLPLHRYNKVHIVLTVASSSFKVQHQKINTNRNQVEY